MAVNQFAVDLVPVQFLLDTYGHVPLTVTREVWEEGNFFQSIPASATEVFPVLQGLGELEDWTRTTDGLKHYRGEAENDATICLDELTGRVEELSFRLDMGYPAEPFLYAILELAVRFDCLLLARPGYLFEPTVSALQQAMEASAARRFVNDPLKFLNDLSKGDITNLEPLADQL